MSQTVERKTPRCMQVEAKTTKSKAGASGALELARFTNDEEGICPACKKPMKLSEINGILVNVCIPDTVVMPLKNQH